MNLNQRIKTLELELATEGEAITLILTKAGEHGLHEQRLQAEPAYKQEFEDFLKEHKREMVRAWFVPDQLRKNKIKALE